MQKTIVVAELQLLWISIDEDYNIEILFKFSTNRMTFLYVCNKNSMMFKLDINEMTCQI